MRQRQSRCVFTNRGSSLLGLVTEQSHNFNTNCLASKARFQVYSADHFQPRS